jgi:hypothetical protein
MAQANDDTTTPSAPSRGALQSINQLRKDAADRIERLIGFLDATDADPDREDNGDGEGEPDDEPILGWTDREAARGVTMAACDSYLADNETDNSDDEPECEDEGAEHDGREPDEDGEPMLGWTEEGEFGDTVASADGEADDMSVEDADRARAAYRNRAPARSNVRPLDGSDGVLVTVQNGKVVGRVQTQPGRTHS